MTDSKRGNADKASSLAHTDAEVLISARLDGPLDPALNRTLLAHLASCDNCRAFASQMDSMATSVRAMPSLPPSAAVSRKVRSEIRGETAPAKRFVRWVTTSKSAPMGAMATAAVALALVVASVFGDLGNDDTNGPSVNAPNFAAVETQTSEAKRDDSGDTGSDSAAQIPNVQVTQAQNAPESAMATDSPTENASGADSAASAPETSTSSSSGDAAAAAVTDSSEAAPTETVLPSDGGIAAASGPVEGDGSSARGSSGAALGDGTGGELPVSMAVDEGQALPSETAEPEPTATETIPATSTLEPTATEQPEPTATTAPEPTETPEPTATAEPEPTETPAPTPSATATVEPTGTATEEPTPTSGNGDSPIIQPRGDSPAATDTASSDTSVVQATGESTIAQRPADSGGDGQTPEPGAADASIVDDSSANAGQTELAGEGSGGEVPSTQGPVSFADLDPVGSLARSGLLLPSASGNYAVERAGGGLDIVSGDGAVLVSGWGYNPVWSEDGQTLYAADGSLSEGGAALISWTTGGGPTYVTSGGSLYDTPAGAANGGLFFIRYQPGAEFSLQLRFTGGEEYVVWESGDYALVGQAIYLYGGEVFVPTNQGWIAIPTGGGEPRNAGSVLGGEFDQLVDFSSGSVAFVSNGAVYMAPASSPGSAMVVGDLGNGGFAWTPYGLAIANGSQVTIVLADGQTVPVVTNGGDLTAPSWTGDGLRIADAADGGTMRILPAETISAILGG